MQANSKQSDIESPRFESDKYHADTATTV